MSERKPIYFEVCCGSAEDAIEAARGGAQRVELNSSMFHGGLTPTIGALRVVKKHTDIPVMCMVRQIQRAAAVLLRDRCKGHGLASINEIQFGEYSS